MVLISLDTSLIAWAIWFIPFFLKMLRAPFFNVDITEGASPALILDASSFNPNYAIEIL
jgi:hypothetical protein